MNTARRLTFTDQPVRVTLATDATRDALTRWVEGHLLNVVAGVAIAVAVFFGVVKPAVDAVPGMLLPAHVVAEAEREVARLGR